jgi:NitT/TauT family transport system ATP-binding protein
MTSSIRTSGCDSGTVIGTAARDSTAPDKSGHRPPLLHFEAVSKTFPDGTEAISDATFTISPAEFVSIVGPSGCGKSTVLRIASGLESATGGAADARTSRIGYVFQDATLLPWRTLRRNVELLAELEGLSRAERARLADKAIRLVGLQGFEDHHPRRLSGGMRMRASVARSLVLSPELFLFDEPFSSVDEITRERLNDELQRLFTDQGFGGLFVTHSVTEAVFLSSRVLVMSARPGRIVAEIPVPFDYPRPHSLRFEPAFGELAGELSRAMRDTGGPGRTDDGAEP